MVDHIYLGMEIKIYLFNMHQFICKSVEGTIVPTQENKLKLLKKILDSYSSNGKSFKLTIESYEKNINEQQISLYNAFILKAADHFGNTFQEMEYILKRFWPKKFNSIYGTDTYKGVDYWNTKELDDFINQSSALLAEQGFKF